MISIERAHLLLRYDPDTGIITWRITRGSKAPAGTTAGSLMSNGYLQVRVDQKDYLAHRLAWFMYYRKWPDFHIDHINGVRTDNRIENLRDVPNLINGLNRHRLRKDNKSGHVGIHFDSRRNKWAVWVGHKYGGRFNKKSDAIKRQKEMAEEIYGNSYKHF